MVTIGISDPANNSMQCSDPDGKTYSKPYSETNNWVCLPPNDAQALFKYCEQHLK